MPSLFVSHGAPTLALEPTRSHRALKELGRALPRPKAILVATAHWQTPEVAISGGAAPPTIHDFGGFPAELYRLSYPAPGSPELAERARALLATAGIAAGVDPARGFDHGTWVPLLLMFPKAESPVVQISVQPGRDAAHHVAVGRALAPLAAEGVLLIGSGGATHNLRDIDFRRRDDPPPEHARAFIDWLSETLTGAREQALRSWRDGAPFAQRNHPSVEHFLPLLVAYGAAGEKPRAEPVHQGWDYGSLAMDCWRFAPAA